MDSVAHVWMHRLIWSNTVHICLWNFFAFIYIHVCVVPIKVCLPIVSLMSPVISSFTFAYMYHQYLTYFIVQIWVI